MNNPEREQPPSPFQRRIDVTSAALVHIESAVRAGHTNPAQQFKPALTGLGMIGYQEKKPQNDYFDTHDSMVQPQPQTETGVTSDNSLDETAIRQQILKITNEIKPADGQPQGVVS